MSLLRVRARRLRLGRCSGSHRDGGRTPDHGDPELEPVFQSDDPAEIQIARSILDGAGIPSVTTNDSASDRILPGFDPFRFMRGARAAVFWVPVDLAEEARALLTEVAPDDDGDATSV